MATVDIRATDWVAHMPGVIAAVREHGTALAISAGSDLSRHRKTGEAHIEVTQGRTDTLISLVDPAALSIEYGHGDYVRDDGAHVGASQGLHVLGKLL